MANLRIKDIATLATSPASDDYIAIDGATNGTRKLMASGLGGGTMYDFASTLTPSIDGRGVSFYSIRISATNIEDLTMPNVMQTYAYLDSGGVGKYPLIITHITLYAGGYYYVNLKSLYGSPQNTASTTVSGTLHVVTPFEVSNVAVSM